MYICTYVQHISNSNKKTNGKSRSAKYGRSAGVSIYAWRLTYKRCWYFCCCWCAGSACCCFFFFCRCVIKLWNFCIFKWSDTLPVARRHHKREQNRAACGQEMHERQAYSCVCVCNLHMCVYNMSVCINLHMLAFREEERRDELLELNGAICALFYEIIEINKTMH